MEFIRFSVFLVLALTVGYFVINLAIMLFFGVIAGITWIIEKLRGESEG